jgi:Putative GTPases (G3E family)
MMKIHLVTGFLGAGKTTYIRKLSRWLAANGQRCAIVENEFGAANVDSAMLSDTDAEILELSGGCICCGLKVNFHDLLISLARSGAFDCVIVEPSGIFNMDDFFEVANSPALSAVSEIGSVITVFSPENADFTDEEAEKVLYAELHSTGLVLVSKASADGAAHDKVNAYIGGLFAKYASDDAVNGVPEIVLKDWNTLTDTDLARFSSARPVMRAHQNNVLAHALLFNSYMIEPARAFDIDSLNAILARIMSGECGYVYRVKGYVKSTGAGTIEINCADASVAARTSDFDGRPQINIIGKRFDRKKISAMFCE